MSLPALEELIVVGIALSPWRWQAERGHNGCSRQMSMAAPIAVATTGKVIVGDGLSGKANGARADPDHSVTGPWTLHWLEAAAAIGAARSRIAADIHAAAEAISRHVELPRIDVLITRIPGFAGIPEIGMVGHAYRPNCFSITVAPDNPHFAAALEAGHVRVTVAHEVNHCLRMRDVGFGRTLGEVLVSEGLAGLFCRRVLGTQPMPWDVAVEPDALRRFFPSDEALASTGYDHAAWFFGREPALYPRWLGYAMGRAIVDAWAGTAPRTATDLVATPAAQILSAVAATFRDDYDGASPER